VKTNKVVCGDVDQVVHKAVYWPVSDAVTYVVARVTALSTCDPWTHPSLPDFVREAGTTAPHFGK